MNKKAICHAVGALLAPLAAHAFPHAGTTYLSRSYLRTYHAASSRSAIRLFGQSAPVVGFAPSNGGAPAETPDGDLELRPGQGVRELVIVDAGIPEPSTLRSGLRTGVELVVLRGGRPGLDELVDVLARYRDLAAVHLVTHGEPGALWLNGTRVDTAALEANPSVLRALRDATRPGADLLLYGCDVAAEDDSLLELIKARAHVDVAASADLTGDERLGGDWELEIRKGRIDASAAFSKTALRDYRHVLRPPNGEFRFGNYFDGNTRTFADAIYTANRNGLVIQSASADLFMSEPGAYIVVAGWGTADTSVQGELRFVSDNGAEFGVGSMVLGAWWGYEASSVSILGFRDGIEVGRKNVTMPVAPFGSSAFVSVDLTTDLAGGSFQHVDAVYVDVVDDVDNIWALLVENMVVYGPPSVSDAHISISGGTGTGGAYIVGDTVTATWDASPAGDRADDVTSVTVDFSEFGGGLVPATKSAGDVWTATYEIAPGTIDATGRNVRVTAENPFGVVTVANTTSAVVDNQPPILSSTLVGLGSPRGPGRPVILNDTIWVAWSPLWDSSADRVAQVTVDFSELGGGSAVPATTETGLWRAEYTIDETSNQGEDLRVSITVTDDAGNSATIRSATGVDVDNEAPGGYGVAFDDILINGARAANVAFTIVGAEVGATYTYSIDSTGGGAAVQGSGVIAGATEHVTGVDLRGLADGTLTMAFTLSDAAGNPGAAVHANAVLDKTAPPPPSQPDLDPVSDTGVSNGDDITSDATPTLVGAAEPASQVRLSSDVDGLIGAATADADGAWSVAVGTALSEGTHRVTAVALDAAGNVSEPSPALALVIDLSAPSAADDAAATDEDESVQIDVLANDHDAGSGLDPASVQIIASPTHGTVSVDAVTGIVTYSPAAGFHGNDEFTYVVRDKGGKASSAAVVSITVEPSNAAPDSDADGMPDDYELEHGFDPHDPSDAAADADGDGVSNRDEFVGGTNPLADDYAPEILPADVVEIDAVGLLTPFPALAAPSAVDGRDGNVQAVLQGDAAYLPPGLHRVIWAATDAAGNRAEMEQLIKVHPQISLAPDEVRAEGSTADVRFILNGPSPSYPLTVAFNVGGTASLGADHDLYPGTITFENGELEKRVPVAIAADAVLEGPETIEITLVGPGNVGPRRTQTVTIVEENAAPRVSLALVQDGRRARLVTADGGQVLISAAVDDPNPGDTHAFEWWFPQGAVTTSVADGVEALDPSSLSPGIHELRLVVRDSGTPALETEIVESFRVVETAPDLAAGDDSDGDGLDDETEGFGDVDDDGSPDYLDGRHGPNVLAERGGDGGLFLVETEPGLRLMVGSVAQLRGGAGAGLSAEDIAAVGIGPDSITNVGGHVDFVVRDIPTRGASVAIVIPQRQPVPENPVYRKHDGIWFTLVEDARNRLASAPGERGVCPPPGSEEYRPGLNVGDWCVELTIEDGGPNDTDGLANGMIRDPGGVGTRGPVSPPPSPPPSVGAGGGGGGGAFGLVGLFGLLGFAALRRRWGRARRRAPRTEATRCARIADG